MEINNFTFIKNNINKNQVLMAIDVSKNNLGIALSSVGLKIALPKITIKRNVFLEDMNKLQALIKEYNVFGIIVGLPLNSDGSKNKQTQLVNSFCLLLKKYIGVNVYMQDERFSTKFIKDSSFTKKKATDENSAAWFLQIFLDNLNKV